MAGVEPPKAMFTAAVKGELSVCQQEMWAAETSGTNEESACKGNNNLENPEDCMPDPGTSELWLGVLKAARLKTLSLLSCYDVRPVAVKTVAGSPLVLHFSPFFDMWRLSRHQKHLSYSA